jgi:hypothetical protein
MKDSEAFRLAIVTADGRCPRWIWDPLQTAMSRGDLALVAVTSLQDLPRPSHPWMVKLYAGWERQRYLRAGSLLEDVDVAAIDGFSLISFGSDESLKLASHLAACRADAVLVTPAAEQGNVSDIGPPIWRVQFGANGQRHKYPGLWEVVDRSLSSVSLVETIPGDGPPRVLETIIARTDPRSWIRNQLGLVSKAADLLQRWLPPQAFRVRRSTADIGPILPFQSREIPRSPLAVLRLLARFGNHARVSALNVEQWQLAIGTSRGLAQLDTPEVLIPPADRFWCDPFLLQKDGVLHVFFEECEYESGKGHIAVLSKSPSGEWSGPIKVLERPYHMSYPFVFEHEGELLMQPETTAAGRVELYRCVRFPDQWELDCVQIDDFPGADATLWFDDARWWLFVDLRDELCLFHSDSPRGPWQPHPGNPVKSDSRSSRPAGRIFRLGDDVIRPAQDCSLQYGNEVVFNKITRLTVCDFDEVEVCRLQVPFDSTIRCHTFNQLGDITVVDRLVTRRKR